MTKTQLTLEHRYKSRRMVLSSDSICFTCRKSTVRAKSTSMSSFREMEWVLQTEKSNSGQWKWGRWCECVQKSTWCKRENLSFILHLLTGIALEHRYRILIGSFRVISLWQRDNYWHHCWIRIPSRECLWTKLWIMFGSRTEDDSDVYSISSNNKRSMKRIWNRKRRNVRKSTNQAV